MKSKADIAGEVVQALVGGERLRVEKLQKIVRVRRERLLQVLTVLEKAELIAGITEMAKARDGKLRPLRAYSLGKEAWEPGSRSPEQGSNHASGGL